MKRAAKNAFFWAPDRLYLQIRYLHRFGKLPNIDTPTTFNENVIALMLSDKHFQLRRIFADKIEASKYIESKVGKQYTPPIIDIIDKNSIDSFRIQSMPLSFVAKSAHASGLVHIVRNKAACDEASLIRTFRSWLKVDFYRSSRERVYRNLPKRIVIEEFLSDRITGGVPSDYKVFVFSGQAKMIQVDLARFDGHTRFILSPDWQLYPCWKTIRTTKVAPEGAPSCPSRLDEMIQIAEQLGAEVDFARIDFYETTDRLVVGEITNYPGGGNGRFYPQSWDMEFGRWFSDASYEPQI